ncbi:APC family permease [Micromonospora rubida]|uniref:APC family permease n=1 Tax=Micromonospora rubida TaxID=2697657 RepID=A0ABW7SSD7_9ACTN
MTGRIGVARGTALYVGAVLGPGVLVLPALAVDAAGPASLLAWAAVMTVSAPIAAAFAALGMRYPDRGGVATFARRAFGPAAGTVVGWWFYAAVPLGMVAGAWTGGRYAAVALGLPPASAAGVATALLGVAYALNLLGLHLPGRLHLALTAGLIGLLATVVTVSVPHVSAEQFTPFAPHGVAGIGSATAVLFVAVSGWEAAAHLAGEFTRPRQQLPIVAAASLGIIAALYAGLAVCTVGVLGSTAGNTTVPLTRLLDTGTGTVAATAFCALLLTFGATFTFVAAAARAGAALGRDGGLPAWLAVTGHAGVPRRSLVVQASGAAVVGVAAAAMPSVVNVDLLMGAFSVLLASVTLLGLAAAVKLLTSPFIRAGAALATIVVGVVAAFGGRLLLFPAAVAITALAWQRHRRRPPIARALTPAASAAAPTPRRTAQAGDLRRSHDRLATSDAGRATHTEPHAPSRH